MNPAIPDVPPANPYPRISFVEEGGRVMFRFVGQKSSGLLEDGDVVFREVRASDATEFPGAWAAFKAAHPSRKTK